MILDAHAHRQLSKADTPDTDLGTFLCQRVLVAGRDDNHRIVHRRLENIHQGNAVVYNLQGLTELQRRGLTLVVTQAAHGGLCG